VLLAGLHAYVCVLPSSSCPKWSAVRDGYGVFVCFVFAPPHVLNYCNYYCNTRSLARPRVRAAIQQLPEVERCERFNGWTGEGDGQTRRAPDLVGACTATKRLSNLGGYLYDLIYMCYQHRCK